MVLQGGMLMNLSEYQYLSKRTLNKELTHEEVLANMCMGISGEGGEVSDIIKKHLFQGHELNYKDLIEEIGDVMFYIVNLCNVLGLDLETILELNFQKLFRRYPEGFEESKSINREL